MTDQFRISTRTPNQYLITADQTSTVLEAGNEQVQSLVLSSAQSLFPLNQDPTTVKTVQLFIDGVNIVPGAPDGFAMSYDLVNMPTAPSGKGIQILLDGVAHPGLPVGTKVMLRYRKPVLTAAANDGSLIAYKDGRTLEDVVSPTYASRDDLLAAAATLSDGDVADVQGLRFQKDADSTHIPDLLAFSPAQYEKPQIAHWETHGDGVQDDTAVIAAIKDFCSSTGRTVDFGSGGVYLIDDLTLAGSQKLILQGDPNNRPMIKGAADVALDHVLILENDATAVLDLFGIAFHGGRGGRADGNAFQIGGAKLVRLDQVLIEECERDGIAYRQGTVEETDIGLLIVKNVGAHALDISDTNSNNGVFNFRHIWAINPSLDETNNAGLDIRGPVSGGLLETDLTGSAYGARLRAYNASSGRSGSGGILRVIARGDGTGVSYPIVIEANEPDWFVGEVHATGTKGAAIFSSTTTGGSVGFIGGKDFTGEEVIGFRGDGVNVLSAAITTSATGNSGELVNFAGDDNGLHNFQVNHGNGAVNPIQIEVGATGNTLSNGVVRSSAISGDGVNDLGTSSVLTNVRGQTI